jgi:cytochrome c-type protein NapC
MPLNIHSTEQLLKVIALVAAAAAVAIIAWYLIRRPPLGRLSKMLLLLGLGVLPLMVSLTGNIAGFEYTLSRPFCGSCHVMGPYLRDAEDPNSRSLAAIHSRNHRFGENSCYNCHADYQMFGAITTKMTGMKHLFKYVTEYASTGPDGEGGPTIKLYKREDLEHGKMAQEKFNAHMNGVCMQCHSTQSAIWVDKHGDFASDLRQFNTVCIDCHNEIHPLALSRRSPAKTAQKEEKK